MRFVIDRFQGAYAVCVSIDNGERQDIKVDTLPMGAKEGSVIVMHSGIALLDEEETRLRAARIQSLMDELWD